MSERLQSILEEGVASGVFPCTRAVVWLHGKCVFEGGAGGATAATGSSSPSRMKPTSLYTTCERGGETAGVARTRSTTARRAAARSSGGQSRSKSRGSSRITVAKNGSNAGRPDR